MSKQTEPNAIISEGRLRVLQLGKFYVPQRGGMESHLKTLCDGIRTSVDVEAIVSSTSGTTTRELCDGVPVTRVARVFGVQSTSINPAMFAAIRQHPAEIVHLHWPNPMAAIAYLASGHLGKLTLTYHCDVVKQRALSRLFSPLLHWLLRRSSRIIVSSEQYLESSPVLARHIERCRVIPLGIAERFFMESQQEAVREARRRFGGPLILSVGRMVEYKGLDFLIRAVQHTPGRLLLVGDGPSRRKLEELVRSLQLEDRIVFLRELPDDELRTLYHAADLLVLPSVDRSEAFGIVQAEAMAAGTPVINTQLRSGVVFVSPTGVTGLTVPHSDASALAKTINHLLSDDAYRRTLGIAARARALALFRAENMCDSILSLYREVCSEPSL